jgi:hypothetical protein
MNTLKIGDIAIATEGCASYLTPNKEYKIKKVNKFGSFHILDDEKELITCLQKYCAHLNLQDWNFKIK